MTKLGYAIGRGLLLEASKSNRAALAVSITYEVANALEWRTLNRMKFPDTRGQISYYLRSLSTS